MELHIFAQFHAREGRESAVEQALGEQVPKVRPERGCLSIGAYRSTHDPRQFWIASSWIDETAFEVHAELPNTIAFVERIGIMAQTPDE